MKPKTPTPLFEEQPIYSYTRAEAIEDGVLAELPEQLLKNAGIKYPTAITSGVWEIINDAVTKGNRDYNGVVWDILMQFRLAAKQSSGNHMNVKVLIWSKYLNADKLFTFKSVIGPGDTAEPVITIMLPNED